MQMGRWFGYRAGYDDLCRVYLSEDSINWYGHIAESAEELRSQIKQMRRYKLSPKDFGLYVKMHPDRLLITAANKMRTGERVTVNHNYTGKIRETHFISAKKSTTNHNYKLIQEVFDNSFGLEEEKLIETDKGWFLNGVETNSIENFISEFQVCSALGDYVDGALQYLRAISEKYPLSDVLFISKKSNEDTTAFTKLGAQERTTAKLDPDGEFWKLSKGRVAGTGDEKWGLSQPALDLAEDYFMDDQEKKSDHEKAKNISDYYYRYVRKKPLLMIHIIRVGEKEGKIMDLPAFGISFPDGDYSVKVEVVANQVYIRNMMGNVFDTPDEDEDYDDE